MSRNFVYSTATAGQTYTTYRKDFNDLAVVEKQVVINGGSNLANKNLVTPLGVVTEVTDEQLELLRGNEMFQRHEKAGFMCVSSTRVDPEVMASDMEQRDDSAPITPNDFTKKDEAVPPELAEDAKTARRTMSSIMGK